MDLLRIANKGIFFALFAIFAVQQRLVGEKAGILLITYRNLMAREIDLKTGGITPVVPNA